jgi:D-sedoheptulose 7-phosphate isomerase
MSTPSEDILADSARVIRALSEQSEQIAEAGRRMARVLSGGGCIYALGNGGSAAQGQHLAAELVGRFEMERPGMPCHALTCNTSTLTAVGNDYGENSIFARQVEALVTDEDLVVCISTSGRSANVLAAAAEANRRGAGTVAMTGQDGGELARTCDVSIRAPSDDTARVQEGHLVVIHLLCGHVEQQLHGSE